MNARNVFRWSIVGLVAAMLALFLLWPLAEGIRGAFVDPNGHFTGAYVVATFRDPIYLVGMRNALFIAVGATLLADAVGIGLALLLDRYAVPARRWLAPLIPLPLLLPPFVGAMGVRQLLGQNGAVNALLGHLGLVSGAHPIDWLRAGRLATVIALTALHLFPFIFFNVQSALAGVNVELEEAAASLGCHGFRRFWKITLPLILPSVFGGTSIALIWGLTELGVPLVADFSRVTSVQIFSGLKDIGHNPFVYALVAGMLLVAVLLYLGARALIGRAPPPVVSKAARRRQLRPLQGLPAAAAFGALALAVGTAALPNLAVVLLALTRDWYGTVIPRGLTLEHFRAAVSHEMVISSIGNSLRYVGLSVTVDLVLGTAIAWIVVRVRTPIARAIDTAAMLPLAVPGLVMAFGYLAISREGRPLSFLNPVRDPTPLLVIAYAMRRMPLVVRSAAAGLAQISVTLEEAAASLGARPLQAFRRVTLPLLAPHLFAGAVFAFALSLLEVSDSLILAQRQATYPITKAIYELFQLLGDGRQVAAALGLWAMLFLLISFAFVRSVLGRRLGNLFRL
jgi:iron(III) transport system permease protein